MADTSARTAGSEVVPSGFADSRIKVSGKNEEAPWNRFDPDCYAAMHYAELYEGDRQILEIVRKFFALHLTPDKSLRGIDVGTGANLYPALAQLPWCRSTTLYELSTSNTAWLGDQVQKHAPMWDSFWEVLSEGPDGKPYRDAKGTEDRTRLRDTATVLPGNLFDLPDLPPESKWDLGTMMFVAESLSSEYQEFDDAVGAFTGALHPRSPFAVALMRHSTGYRVGNQHFPAYSVGEGEVYKAFEKRVDLSTFRMHSICLPKPAKDEGGADGGAADGSTADGGAALGGDGAEDVFKGMILVCGHTL
ncbi:SCO2525 family SAM-dependent methyltransferase [Streptomyces sp. NBC_00237]|uniref:SCO2525 family SAM-dependent methyltransferase n=1 Tax=Streptomyces sp. NBC_00237 TaxID=2975687 RepID=UPI00224E0383|nr:SCO2525 family SAM-dependent methyltransferase [Streptomyces sp. NBC_00237]MCX5201844.1 SCO2525 family SAM-dependent methyltransferase [Streptomyces sp. NBC_00237]